MTTGGMSINANVFVWTAIIFASQVEFSHAEIAPRKIKELQQCDIIIIGTIKDIRVVTERSELESGVGNYDWAIYVTIDVEAVEKGVLDSDRIEFRCFRIRSRRSFTELLSPSGHYPIPPKETRVRVYLNKTNDGYRPVLPNGITDPNANDDESLMGNALSDAEEVAELRNKGFTWLIPLEVWGIIFIIALSLGIAISIIRGALRSKRINQDNSKT